MKLAALCALPVVVLAWYALGYQVVRIAGMLARSGRDLILCTLTGFGLLGMIIAGLGFLQLWHRSILILLVVVSMLSGFTGAYRYGYGVLRTARWQWSLHRFWIEYCCLLFLLIYGICALLPPTGIDELMYHLSVPRLYLEHHGFYDIGWNTQANLPLLAEMNYALGIVFDNHVLCRLIAACASLLCVLMLAIVARSVIAEKKYVWLAILIFLSHTNTVANFNECNVDLINAAFILAAMLFMQQWKAQPTTGSAIMTALMLGFVIQSKAFGILALPVAVAMMVVPFRKMTKPQLLQIVLMISLPLAGGLIWYLKSQIYQGVAIVGMDALATTVVPVAAGGVSITDQLIKYLVLLGSNIISAPWSYSLQPALHRMDSFGPLFIGIVPFLLLIRNKKPVGTVLAWGGGLWLMFIVLSTMRGMQGGMSIRYLTATIALLSIAAGYVISQTDSIAARRLLLLCVVVSVGLNGAMTLKRYRTEIVSVITGESWHDYLIKNYLPYTALQYINSQTPPGTRVAAPFCFGTYYINRPYEVLTRQHATSAELIDDCNTRNISYLFANDVLDTNTNRRAFFEGAGLKLVCDHYSFKVYEIPSTTTTGGNN